MTADAVSSVNSYRAMSGLAPVTFNSMWVQGAVNHSCYMLQNGITHTETVGLPGYTADGASSGMRSDVAVSSSVTMSASEFVDLWMTGPFHAIGILRPNLKAVAYGSCAVSQGPLEWRAGGTLDVVSGLGTKQKRRTPIVWPGNGARTKLDRFIAETPSPVAMCGWGSGGGLPVIALMPEPALGVRASVTGPDGPLQTCVLTAANT
jgi:hypothetical protein